MNLCFYIFKAAISSLQVSFLRKRILLYSSHHNFCNISLIVAFKRILRTNMKNCNFDIRRIKILCKACLIYFLSHKLSFVIIFYFMNTTLMSKLNQYRCIGKERNGKNIICGPCFINISV